MRVENLRLALLKGVTLQSRQDVIVVKAPADGSRATLPAWTSFLLNTLDGSVFFSDILRAQKQRMDRSTKLRELVEIVLTLAKNNLLENSREVKTVMQSLSSRNEVLAPEPASEPSSSPEEAETDSPSVVKFDQQRLIYYLRKTPLMGSTQDVYFKNVLKHSEVLNYRAGSRVVAHGDEAKDLYVLLEGRAGVYTPEGAGRKFLALLQPVTVFGESAAALGRKRTADVITLDDSTLLRVNLQKVLGTRGGEDTSLSDLSSLKTRLLLHQLLFSSSLFSGLPSEVFQLVLEKSSKISVAANEPVVYEGESDKSFYLILKGSLGVYREQERVATLSRGDHFGEIAALFNRPRTATLKAFSPSILLKISQEDMIDLACEHLSLGLHLEDVALARLHAPRTLHRSSMGPDLDHIDDLSNPFGNVHDGDSTFFDLPLPELAQQDMDELELDFNFDFSQRE